MSFRHPFLEMKLKTPRQKHQPTFRVINLQRYKTTRLAKNTELIKQASKGLFRVSESKNHHQKDEANIQKTEANPAFPPGLTTNTFSPYQKPFRKIPTSALPLPTKPHPPPAHAHVPLHPITLQSRSGRDMSHARRNRELCA
jgi:hypothetical protein